ncbi:S26 family signal peptidase [Kribbella albertanoniae]|uniref:Peptidase S26 domain-containing protein n=1 Tax=Kribbella albertanoniae TaxID=1266829 RepID=A0A4R4QBQ8_9ACTN|nr:S26 family signal peptidase [Kribbella albertanoniae]TDC32483.1 hypothetical protein E1261_08320 [Kribbella albertanoniae]
MVPAVVVTIVLAAVGLFAASRRPALVRVAGQSMTPTLADGDRLLAWRRSRPLRVGDIVVLEAPYPVGVVPHSVAGALDPPPWQTRPASAGELDRRWIVKRIVALPADVVPPEGAGRLVAGTEVPPGCLVVVGDNPAQSYDSRQAGFVPADRVLGLVIRRLK